MEARIYTATEARGDFAELINQAAYGHERVVIQRRGREIAAVIPIEDLRLLERLIEQEEDRIDLEEAQRILSDPAEEPIPWEDVKKGL